MADSWFTLENGTPSGPYSEAELQVRYLWGELDDDVALWKMAKKDGTPEPPITAGSAPFLSKPPATWLVNDDTRAAVELNRPSLYSRADLLLALSGSCALLAWFACKHWAPSLERARVLFVCELAAFAGLWIVYFMSRHGEGEGFFHVATLRRLLRLTAKTWRENERDLGEAFRLKAEKTIGATAMLVATSGVVLTRVAQSYHDWEIKNPNQGFCWESATCMLALLGGFTAIVCFVLSVDSLDVVANTFTTRKITTQLRAHFYMSTINPRYGGFVLLLTSIVVMLAFRSALLGSAALAIVLGVGYTHWFPRLDVLTREIGAEKRLEEARRGQREFLVRLSLLVLPTLLVWRYPGPPNAPAGDGPAVEARKRAAPLPH
jgi:hypothetical protein